MDRLLVLMVLISLVFLIVIILGFIVMLSKKDVHFNEIPSETWFDFAGSVLKKTYVFSMLALNGYIVVKLRLFTIVSFFEHVKANILGLFALAAVLFFSSILSLFEFAICLGIIESFAGSPERDMKRISAQAEEEKTQNDKSVDHAIKQDRGEKTIVAVSDRNMREAQNKSSVRSVAELPKVKAHCPDMNRIDMMNALQFEAFCVELLKQNGFRDVRTTPKTGDQGVDIIATKDGIRHAIQCKHYKTNVGNGAVQEVHTGKTFYHCSVGVVLTNSHFTSSAQELAKASQTLLWDRSRLKKLMENMESS